MKWGRFTRGWADCGAQRPDRGKHPVDGRIITTVVIINGRRVVITCFYVLAVQLVNEWGVRWSATHF